MKIEWLKTLHTSVKHNAFTDLCLFDNALYCSFREASNHVSGDGRIRIVTCNLRGEKIWQDVIRIPNADLRDPKLTITPDGRLMLLVYARFVDKTNRTVHSKSFVSYSDTGRSWSAPQYFGPRFWWLWRLRWHQDKCYGFAYNRRKHALDLYAGTPGRSFFLCKQDALSLATHGLGYPNESDLFFADSQQLYAIVRRDADTCSAQLGYAKLPFTRWIWRDLQAYFASPVVLQKDDDHIYVAGRQWLDGKPYTVLAELALDSGVLSRRLVLPSAGDNGYPGLVRADGKLYLSYYSAHIGNSCDIYLAKLEDG